jgi:hypothetical protein
MKLFPNSSCHLHVTYFLTVLIINRNVALFCEYDASCCVIVNEAADDVAIRRTGILQETSTKSHIIKLPLTFVAELKFSKISEKNLEEEIKFAQWKDAVRCFIPR